MEKHRKAYKMTSPVFNGYKVNLQCPFLVHQNHQDTFVSLPSFSAPPPCWGFATFCNGALTQKNIEKQTKKS